MSPEPEDDDEFLELKQRAVRLLFQALIRAADNENFRREVREINQLMLDKYGRRIFNYVFYADIQTGTPEEIEELNPKKDAEDKNPKPGATEVNIQIGTSDDADFFRDAKIARGPEEMKDWRQALVEVKGGASDKSSRAPAKIDNRKDWVIINSIMDCARSFDLAHRIKAASCLDQEFSRDLGVKIYHDDVNKLANDIRWLNQIRQLINSFNKLQDKRQKLFQIEAIFQEVSLWRPKQ